MDSCSHSRSWRHLPSALQLHILSLLPPNHRALSGRLVWPEARDILSEPQDCTVSLSQPLPPHAVPWAMEAGQQHVRQLPFMQKLQLLCTAAASGSEVNLEVAWALLRPSIFPELLQTGNPAWKDDLPTIDPGVAAAKAGHPQVLSWLLQHCPALLCPHRMILAAARHCDLAGLQATWAACQQAQLQVDTSNSSSSGGGGGSSSSSTRAPLRPVLGPSVLHAAAESSTADGMDKMEWVLAAGNLTLEEGIVLSAVRSGDLRRLQWLHDRGCRYLGNAGCYAFSGYWTLQHAFGHADLGVVQWLVDEGGFGLPGDHLESWHGHLLHAVKSAEAVAKLHWLRERGAPLRDLEDSRLEELVMAAATAGRADAVRYLLSLYRPGVDFGGGEGEAASDGGRLAAQLLRQAGIALPPALYKGAVEAGNLALVRWLVLEARASASGLSMHDVIERWPNGTTANSRDLLEVVQLLADAGCRPGYGALQYAAAEEGYLALYQYLQQRWPLRQPYGKLVSCAAAGGCEVLLQRLAEKHSYRFQKKPAVHPYCDPAKAGDLGTLLTLWLLGVPWNGTNVVTKAFNEGCPLPAVRWLVARGAPVGKRTVMETIAKKLLRSTDEDTAAWLRGLVAAAATD